MRVPVAVTLESRDGTVSKDAKVLNGIVETKGDQSVLRKRQGLSDLGLISAGTAQLLYAWNGLNAIIGDTLYRGTQSSIVSSPSSTTAISPSVAGLRFDAQEVGPSAATQVLMIKNRTQAWTVNGAGTKTSISFPSSMGAATYSVVSLTRSGTTATASLATDPGLSIGDSITVAGAGQSAYNITAPVIAVSSLVASTVTWNPLDKGSAVTLSNGNLTVTSAAPVNGASCAVRANTGKSSGKWYWEITLNDSTAVDVGVANLSATLDCLENNSGNSWAWGQGLAKFPSGASYGSGFTIGDVIGVALDMDGGTLTFYQNGVSKGTAFTGLSGTLYPAVSSSPNHTTNTTANFGATSFAYSVPSGYSALQAASSFTVSYTVSGSPTTPATGTITLSVNGGMVPGLPYIDGYFFVMDQNGVMWQSNSDDPSTWGALNFLTAQNENGKGKALAKSLNYLIAFKEWSTEFFNDTHNATGFAFSPIDNGFIQIGCAHGDSVAKLDGNLIWLSQVKEFGRGVHLMNGLQAQKISTPDVERILNQDSLSTVYSLGVKIGGHAYYILTLVSSNITLVYDLASQAWTQWSSLTAGNAVSVSSITSSNGVATVTTSSAHGLSDGDPVTIAGANQSAYNGTFQATYVSSTVFTVPVSGSPVTPATGTITATPYTSSYFKFTKYADYLGANLFLHETNGHLYQMLPSLYQDAGTPIDLFVRTTRLDGGSTEVKVMSRATVIGDAISDIVMLRWSDDDSQTFSAYRSVDLSLERPSLRRCGKFRRRSVEMRHVGNSNPRIEALELEIPQ